MLKNYKYADMAIINGKIITVDQEFSIKQAVAVKDGRIMYVGENRKINSFIGSGTRVFDLDGHPVLPGINESHMHGGFFGGTRPPLTINLAHPKIKSIREMVEALRRRVVAMEPGKWIRGFGWNQWALEECKDDSNRLPRKTDIDPASPEHPVVFTDFSGHTLLANSKALELAGITKETPDPESGEMERDPATGDPTGIFKEQGAKALIHRVVPPYTRDEKKQAILTALSTLNGYGVTSFTDAGLGPGGNTFGGGTMGEDCIDVYKDLYDEGKLTARTIILLLMGEYGAVTIEDIENSMENFTMPTGLHEDWLRIAGIKLFADGVPRTKTAWMYDEYEGGGCGSLAIPGNTDEQKLEHLLKMIKYYHSLGFQIGIHAVGDRAIDVCVEGLIKAMERKPGANLRHYIIHGNFVNYDCIKKMAKYNIGLSTQPTIKGLTSDFFEKLVGEERSASAWPNRTCLEAGIKLTGNSDAPVTHPDWRLGVQTAILRESLITGKVSGPEQCVNLEEAIRMYTINGAWQDQMEKVKGSIEVGKFGDFCVIGDDLLQVDPHNISEIPVLMTVVGGKIVFDDSGGAFE